MLILLLIFILILAVISFFSESLPKPYHQYLLWGTIAAFLFIAIIRPGSYDSDYKVYEMYFYGFNDKKVQIIVEPLFLWICKTVYYARGTMRTIIYIFAIISIPLKIFSIRKITDETLFILTAIVYASNYYMLHDCEQIRLAAGMAFGMLAIWQKTEKHYVVMTCAWLIGISFHHTLAILIIPLLISPKNFGRKWKYVLAASVPIAIGLWILHINPITILPIPYIETRLLLYEMAIAEGKHPDIRVLNLMVLLRIALFYYILYFYDNIKHHLQTLPILIVCDALSLIAWFTLTEMSVIAVRISQLFGFIEVILFASIYYTIKQAWVGKFIVILIALYLYTQNYIYNQFGFR